MQSSTVDRILLVQQLRECFEAGIEPEPYEIEAALELHIDVNAIRETYKAE